MVKETSLKLIVVYFLSLLISPSLCLAKDKSSTPKNTQLPAPKVSPSKILDSDYLQGRRFEDRFLNLGVDKKFTILERDLIKVQVKNFIPPLLVPAVGGHAFVLPPGLFNFSTSFKFVNVEADDWYKDGKVDNIHRENQIQRRFVISSLKYGFDLDKKYFHSFTAVLNVTYESSVNRGPVRLPDIGNNAKSVFNTGTSDGVQDINLMLKKKIWDQGNKPIGWAIAAGVYFPTGDTDKKAGDDGVISVQDDSTKAVTKPIFKRFTDTGELPAGRQLGNGEMSYKVATFFTRQFLPGDMPDFLAGTPFDRAAIHWGAAYRFNFEHDGVDPGDKATIFGSMVMPVHKDYLSFQLSTITNWQANDTYEGNFQFPNASSAVPRPDFRGGWLSLLGASFIYSPDPLIRFTATALTRVLQPSLGPSPSYVANFGFAASF
jgi:hypothetical protein